MTSSCPTERTPRTVWPCSSSSAWGRTSPTCSEVTGMFLFFGSGSGPGPGLALALLLAGAAAAAPPDVALKAQVAASLPDLASTAASVGGNRVEVFAIAKASANPHSVEVLPSYMIKVARARVYLKVGLWLDGWADAVIDGSRNKGLLVADCSAGIPVLEKPEGKVDASHGDVHPHGNPHYWL